MRGWVIASAFAFAAACVPPSAQPGMVEVAPRAHDAEPSLVELARVPGERDRRPLLVVYPRTGCSGSASMVLVDDHARFVGAVLPGSATLLAVPSETRTLFAISSVEIAAPVRTWSALSIVDVPAAPSGLLLRSRRWSGRDCGTGQYADVVTATKAELEDVLAEEDDRIRWLAPRPSDGQAWLDAHRARVREVIARGPAEDWRAR